MKPSYNIEGMDTAYPLKVHRNEWALVAEVELAMEQQHIQLDRVFGNRPSSVIQQLEADLWGEGNGEF